MIDNYFTIVRVCKIWNIKYLWSKFNTKDVSNTSVFFLPKKLFIIDIKVVLLLEFFLQSIWLTAYKIKVRQQQWAQFTF